MDVINTSLPEVLLIKPKIFKDSRGFFLESWNSARYEEIGLPKIFLQDNISYSEHGVLRGLHFQEPNAQGKLISVLKGDIFDVAVDIRLGSPRFGKWVGLTLTADTHHQIWIPPGFAHGFLVTSPTALVSYKSSAFYSPETEGTVLWNDPALNIIWPLSNPNLAEKDMKAPPLSQIPQSKLPKF